MLVCGECVGDGEAAPDLWGDDRWEPSEPDSDGESEDEAERLEGELRAELEQAKRLLGTRHGGFNKKDAREQEKILRAEEDVAGTGVAWSKRKRGAGAADAKEK